MALPRFLDKKYFNQSDENIEFVSESIKWNETLKDVSLHMCAEPTGSSYSGQIKHFVTEQALFELSPSVHDIEKTNFTKNHTLLLCLKAILQLPDGDNIIREMFREEGSRVVVRLFDDYGSPHFLAVPKTLPNSNALLNGGALWVKMLEKAIIALESKNFQGKYSALSKLQSFDKVMRMLASSSYTGESNLPFQSRKKFSDLKGFMYAEDAYAFHDLMHLTFAAPDKLKEKFLTEIFKGKQNLLDAWITFIEHNQLDWKSQINKKHPIYYSTVDTFFENNVYEGYQDQMEALNAVRVWLKNDGYPILPHAGLYTAEESQLFEKIRNNLQQSCPLLVKINNSLINLEQECTISSAEEKDGRKYIVLQSIEATKTLDLKDFCHVADAVFDFNEVSVMAIDNRILARRMELQQKQTNQPK